MGKSQRQLLIGLQAKMTSRFNIKKNKTCLTGTKPVIGCPMTRSRAKAMDTYKKSALEQTNQCEIKETDSREFVGDFFRKNRMTALLQNEQLPSTQQGNHSNSAYAKLQCKKQAENIEIMTDRKPRVLRIVVQKIDVNGLLQGTNSYMGPSESSFKYGISTRNSSAFGNGNRQKSVPKTSEPSPYNKVKPGERTNVSVSQNRGMTQILVTSGSRGTVYGRHQTHTPPGNERTDNGQNNRVPSEQEQTLDTTTSMIKEKNSYHTIRNSPASHSLGITENELDCTLKKNNLHSFETKEFHSFPMSRPVTRILEYRTLGSCIKRDIPTEREPNAKDSEIPSATYPVSIPTLTTHVQLLTEVEPYAADHSYQDAGSISYEVNENIRTHRQLPPSIPRKRMQGTAIRRSALPDGHPRTRRLYRLYLEGANYNQRPTNRGVQRKRQTRKPVTRSMTAFLRATKTQKEITNVSVNHIPLGVVTRNMVRHLEVSTPRALIKKPNHKRRLTQKRRGLTGDFNGIDVSNLNIQAKAYHEHGMNPEIRQQEMTEISMDFVLRGNGVLYLKVPMSNCINKEINEVEMQKETIGRRTAVEKSRLRTRVLIPREINDASTQPEPLAANRKNKENNKPKSVYVSHNNIPSESLVDLKKARNNANSVHNGITVRAKTNGGRISNPDSGFRRSERIRQARMAKLKILSGDKDYRNRIY